MAAAPKQAYHVHITSRRRWLEFNLRELWQYRDLVLLFTRRSFQVSYRQTILGPLWLFLNPLITAVIYTFVFGEIARIHTDGVPHILFYLCSTTVWSFFSSCLTRNASTFTANARLFSKVYFPRLTVPVSNVLFALIQFGIQMLITAGFLVCYTLNGQVQPNWGAWTMVPVILLHLGLMGLGFGIIISSLTTKYRDLSFLVSFGVQLWMYATPIVYPLAHLADSPIKNLLRLNPLTAPIEAFRYAVLGRGTVDVPGILWSWAITSMVVMFGIMIFNRVEKTSVDTV